MYNREKTIKKAIDSVLNQTYSNIELIIVDDGSIDSSVNVVEKYANNKVKLIVLPCNSGANTARNIGIEASKGDYIAFQDSDDEWLPDKLMIQINYMMNTGHKVAFCPYTLYLSDNLQEQVPTLRIIQRIKEEGINSVLRERNVVGTPTLIIEREIIDKVGVFDEIMPRRQDYDYIIRLAQKYDIGFIEQPLVNAYRQEDSITNNINAFYEATEILLEKHGNFLNLEKLLENSMPLNTMEYDERFSASIKRLRQLYAKEDREKEEHFNDIIIDIFGKKYIDAKRKDKLYIESKILRLKKKEFAIYGAGKIARKIYYELKRRKLCPEFFIVSKKAKNAEEYIDNIPVEEISDVKNKRIEIIVAVSAKYQQEVLDNLIRWDFENYFFLDYMDN